MAPNPSPPPPREAERDGSAPLEFGSPAWTESLARAVNGDPVYRQAGQGWGVGFNGNVLFAVEPDGALRMPVHLLLRLANGACEGVDRVPPGETGGAGFVLRAPYGVWRKILAGELKAAGALFTGKLRVEGSKSLLLKYTRAAQALLRIAAEVPTRFP